MLQRLRDRVQRQEGFTLIELLVVILIIGILAAVAIPTFLGQTSKATDSNTQSLVQTAEVADMTYWTDTGGTSYATAASTLTTYETTLNQANVTCAPTTGPPYNTACALGADASITAVKFPGTKYASTALTASSSFDVYATSPTGITYAITRDENGTIYKTCSVPTSVSNSGGCNTVGNTAANGATAGTW